MWVSSRAEVGGGAGRGWLELFPSPKSFDHGAGLRLGSVELAAFL